MMQTTLALLACVGSVALQSPSYPTEEEAAVMFTRFNKEYNRTSTNDSPGRFHAFMGNIKAAIDLNAEQNVTCKDLFDDANCVFGITKFSDMFQDEFELTHLGYKPSADSSHEEAVLSLDDLRDSLKDAPSSVDWRKHGAVSAVKDQGSCGSCWAFSATEEIESAVFQATGKLPVLSTQQIISCDKKDDGCNGGDTPTAYKFVQKNGGIDSASDYPDRSHKSGKTGRCQRKSEIDAKVTGFSYAVKPCNKGACKQQDETALAAALATKGPISICLNAGGGRGGNGWQNYKQGIFSAKCSSSAKAMDHCVQLVGYDKSGSTPYWIIRNSWAASWGMSGYIHLQMGKNLCGVANEATIVHATTGPSIVTV